MGTCKPIKWNNEKKMNEKTAIFGCCSDHWLLIFLLQNNDEWNEHWIVIDPQGILIFTKPSSIQFNGQNGNADDDDDDYEEEPKKKKK